MNMKKYLYVNALSSLGSRMDLIACSALIFTFEHSAFWLMAFLSPDRWAECCSARLLAYWQTGWTEDRR